MSRLDNGIVLFPRMHARALWKHPRSVAFHPKRWMGLITFSVHVAGCLAHDGKGLTAGRWAACVWLIHWDCRCISRHVRPVPFATIERGSKARMTDWWIRTARSRSVTFASHPIFFCGLRNTLFINLEGVNTCRLVEVSLMIAAVNSASNNSKKHTNKEHPGFGEYTDIGPYS